MGSAYTCTVIHSAGMPRPGMAGLLCHLTRLIPCCAPSQSVYELSDGSGLVLTVGKYVTPNGTDIDREGLQPDFRSRPGADAAEQAIQACRLQRVNTAAAPQLVDAAATQQQ